MNEKEPKRPLERNRFGDEHSWGEPWREGVSSCAGLSIAAVTAIHLCNPIRWYRPVSNPLPRRERQWT